MGGSDWLILKQSLLSNGLLPFELRCRIATANSESEIWAIMEEYVEKNGNGNKSKAKGE